MGIGEFFKALFGGQAPAAAMKVEKTVDFSGSGARGRGAASRHRVSVIVLLKEVRQYLAENLKPVVEAEGYDYDDSPSFSTAIGSRFVIMDASPDSDAKLHARYDKLVRMKKSMGKFHDVLCVIAPRENVKKYPRGTYPGLLFFCLNGADLNHREPDLPPEGMETVIGPRLHNLCDLPVAFRAKVAELSQAKPRTS